MAEIENLKIGNGTIHIVGNQDIVADSWEAGKTYVADRSYVIREHILYVCNTTHTSVEPFDPTKWTATTIGEALGMAGSANVIECTLAEYTAWKAGGLLINETTYILTDAPNLNATAQDLSYDGGATSTHDVIEEQVINHRQVYSYRVTNVGNNIVIRMKINTSGEFLVHIVGAVSNGNTFYDSIITGSVSGRTVYVKNHGTDTIPTPVITNNTVKFTVANWSQLLISSLQPISEITKSTT